MHSNNYAFLLTLSTLHVSGITCYISLFHVSLQFSLVAQLCLTLCDPMDCSTPDFPVHHQLPELAQTHVSDAIQPSQPVPSPSPPAFSVPASGSFPVSQFFASGGQSIEASALESVLPMNTQDWSPLEWTGWLSLKSKGLSRVFSNTTVQKHQFLCIKLRNVYQINKLIIFTILKIRPNSRQVVYKIPAFFLLK